MDPPRLAGRRHLEGKLISGAAAIQAFTGLATIVLGVIALGTPINEMALDLAALTALGGALCISGSAMMAAPALHT